MTEEEGRKGIRLGNSLILAKVPNMIELGWRSSPGYHFDLN